MSLEHAPIRGRIPGQLHLTRDELAERWRVQAQWVTRHYAKLGLRTLKVGKRILFSLAQIEEIERRAFEGDEET
jgi:hypothetical protein